MGVDGCCIHMGNNYGAELYQVFDGQNYISSFVFQAGNMNLQFRLPSPIAMPVIRRPSLTPQRGQVRITYSSPPKMHQQMMFNQVLPNAFQQIHKPPNLNRQEMGIKRNTLIRNEENQIKQFQEFVQVNSSIQSPVILPVERYPAKDQSISQQNHVLEINTLQVQEAQIKQKFLQNAELDQNINFQPIINEDVQPKRQDSVIYNHQASTPKLPTIPNLSEEKAETIDAKLKKAQEEEVFLDNSISREKEQSIRFFHKDIGFGSDNKHDGNDRYEVDDEYFKKQLSQHSDLPQETKGSVLDGNHYQLQEVVSEECVNFKNNTEIGQQDSELFTLRKIQAQLEDIQNINKQKRKRESIKPIKQNQTATIDETDRQFQLELEVKRLRNQLNLMRLRQKRMHPQGSNSS